MQAFVPWAHKLILYVVWPANSAEPDFQNQTLAPAAVSTYLLTREWGDELGDAYIYILLVKRGGDTFRICQSKDLLDDSGRLSICWFE